MATVTVHVARAVGISVPPKHFNKVRAYVSWTAFITREGTESKEGSVSIADGTTRIFEGDDDKNPVWEQDCGTFAVNDASGRNRGGAGGRRPPAPLSPSEVLSVPPVSSLMIRFSLFDSKFSGDRLMSTGDWDSLLDLLRSTGQRTAERVITLSDGCVLHVGVKVNVIAPQGRAAAGQAATQATTTMAAARRSQIRRSSVTALLSPAESPGVDPPPGVSPMPSMMRPASCASGVSESSSAAVSLSQVPTPVASSWILCFAADSGRGYFYNIHTGVTTWTVPDSGFMVPQPPDSADLDAPSDPWVMSYDATSRRPYYYQIGAGDSVWSLPEGATVVHSSQAAALSRTQWQEMRDPGSFSKYYVHKPSRRTTWTMPMQGYTPVAETPASSTTAASSPLVDDWTECVDNSTGRTYYYNSTTGESSWVHPLAATMN